MTLSPGSRLGPYEILSPLGAGGMGEVRRARDTRLELTAAVKVLPSHRSSSPEVGQRFEREVKTISRLSHPHICALYDVGRKGETEHRAEGITESHRSFVASPGGQPWPVNAINEEAGPVPITIVVNWSSDSRRSAPNP